MEVRNSSHINFANQAYFSRSMKRNNVPFQANLPKGAQKTVSTGLKTNPIVGFLKSGLDLIDRVHNSVLDLSLRAGDILCTKLNKVLRKS